MADELIDDPVRDEIPAATESNESGDAANSPHTDTNGTTSGTTDLFGEPAEEKEEGTVPEEFIRDIRVFGEMIHKNPGLVEQIRDIFEYHLVDATDRRTFSRIVNALTMVLGHNATMIVATACHINAAPFFDDLQKHVDDDEKDEQSAISALKHLTALYGGRIQEAYALSVGVLDEDWFTADINTYRREGDLYWMTELQMALYNGTDMHLQMTPESLFQLTLIMMKEATKLPAEAFDPELIARYEDDIRSFASRFVNKKDDGAPPGYA
ncbi:MAG: hypothetical protein D5R99_05220 [Methanocalculus sp. MSAO_Arc1]|uniref:hypothetical protein n=1 Tax=Methanocalculus TaxID=71151 RepID=UPI000FEE5B12|nr:MULTISPECIES: hypothetical protein [unclassified Methanocalculus]MCP1662687.1 hypothetical protein [Methanocalculus sp. AMF5]RQD80284.1 MAG: hypothetical protein D5R99_05220 [Methanocalculus sp. MSAO_Arc1]